MRAISDKLAIISGGAGGIGLAMASKLPALCAHMAIADLDLARRNLWQRRSGVCQARARHWQSL